MKFTGERAVLGYGGIANSRMRYKDLLPHCYGKKILDFGCGIGHGSHMLAEFAADVTGYDIAADAIEEAKRNFSSENLRYTTEWDPDLLLRDRDMVVSVEAIEHPEKDDLVRLLELCSERVPSFACTTPNGDMFPYHPATPEERELRHLAFRYHVWHYTYEELHELFNRFYKFVTVMGNGFDPNPDIIRFTGYSVFATNAYPTWEEERIITELATVEKNADAE